MASEKNHNKDKAPQVTPQVSVQGGSPAAAPLRRTFPGPANVGGGLRVTVDRAAYADLVAHAKGSLDAEVCGVLVGHICEDDEGVFVHVEATIRGAEASQGSTHVTFTHATWNAIHQSLERDYPKLRMVGWYHTHPGFGVEFSDMDLFVQKNFFPGPHQIALVTDPLSGAVAICVNGPEGAKYLPRFWVDGREQACRCPAPATPASSSVGAPPATGETSAEFQKLEARVSQLVQLVDEQQRSYYRFLMFIGTLVCLGIVAAVGYTIYSQMAYRNEPPKLNQYARIPIQIGDKTVLLGVEVNSWEVPPELDAMLLKEIKLRLEAEAKAAKKNKGGDPKADSSEPPPPAKSGAVPPTSPAKP